MIRWLNVQKDVEGLVDDLLSLSEPWRSRFLRLVAERATGGAWNGDRPTRRELAAWLGTDLGLYREVSLLLRAWKRNVPDRRPVHS